MCKLWKNRKKGTILDKISLPVTLLQYGRNHVENKMDEIDYIIDIQAFQDRGGHFLPKEITVFELERNLISHWIIKPPYSCSKLTRGLLATNSYLTCYHHGIE